jgi:predicted metalloprotease with PDZ domain
MPSKVNKIKVIDKKLGRQRAVGLAWSDAKIIEIDPRQTSKNYLDTLIHELLHVYNPEWSETKVTKTANEMTTIIWKKNYRRIKR